MEEKTNDAVNEATKNEQLMLSVMLDGKECRLNAEEAAALAQKGFDYEAIKDDYERIKELALSDGHSVGEFLSLIETQRLNKRRAELLDKCAGNAELADYILLLEAKKKKITDYGLKEVKEYFPSISSIEELPQEVVERSRLRGSSLLDELLRYRHKKSEAQKGLKRAESSASASSVGSQREYIVGDYDPAKLQFIKGIWGK